MSQSNFQDAVFLTSATLGFGGDVFRVGTDGTSKYVEFANSVGAIALLGAATGAGTGVLSLPHANGTVGLITAISGGTTRFSNGQLVFSNSPTVSFGIDGSTITASAAGGPGGSMDYVFVMQLVGV